MNDMEPQSNNLMPPGQVDHEGAMAKADLFKLANYSVKLFKKIDDNDQLESWVQAKITKAADYVASVYHYLEYEMKFSEFGAKLENSEMYSESEKLELKNKLNEAKNILRAIKIAQAQKLEEAKSPKAKKDYDKDGKIESEKDEVVGSRRKAAGLDETKGKSKKPYDFDAAAKHDEEEYQLDRKDPHRHSINPKDDDQYDRDQDREYYHYNESWDDDDEDDDVKRADSELKKRGVKLPKVKEKEVPIKKTRKDREEEELDEMYGVGVYEDYDDDDEDDDVKRADSELKKRGVKLPKVKHKEVPVKKTAKDKDEEQLDELSHATLKSYADKKGDQMFSQKKPASGKDLTNYRKAINKMHKKEDDGQMNETSEEKKKAYRDAAGKDMQKAAKEGDKATISKRLRGVSASLKEASKPDFLDLDKDGNKKEPMKKAAKEKKCDEAAPSAGLSAKQKSATVKKAKAGGAGQITELSKNTLGNYVKKAAQDSLGQGYRMGRGNDEWNAARTGGKAFGKAVNRNRGIDRAVDRLTRESVNEGRRGGPIDNFTGDDISNLSKMNDLEAMKARAVELIQTPSAKPIKPEKVQYYLHQIDKMTKPVQILELMYNMLLGGEGHGVIGSKGSMSKNSYRSRFDEWGGDPAELNKSNSIWNQKSSYWDDGDDDQYLDSWTAAIEYNDVQRELDKLGVQLPIAEELIPKLADKLQDIWGEGPVEAFESVLHGMNDDARAEENDADAYDENDPKHPNWAQRQLDKADLRESAELDAIKSLTKRLLG